MRALDALVLAASEGLAALEQHAPGFTDQIEAAAARNAQRRHNTAIAELASRLDRIVVPLIQPINWEIVRTNVYAKVAPQFVRWSE